MLRAGLRVRVRAPALGADSHRASFTLDLSPTKHVVMLLHRRDSLPRHAPHRRARSQGSQQQAGQPKGFANGIEALVLYIRQEVVLPNVGHHGEKYAPFILTLFFFILFANLLGLDPIRLDRDRQHRGHRECSRSSRSSSSRSRACERSARLPQDDLLLAEDQPLHHEGSLLSPILTPIELAGKFTKPFALAIRLFANMTAGHIVVLALIGLIFTFGSY